MDFVRKVGRSYLVLKRRMLHAVSTGMVLIPVYSGSKKLPVMI